ncbi:Aminomethyltransferase, mitochondrial [Araneus ventricosus]|uniref:Aminomethyltransferase, mitochondrial n=1 Tax=Araneus ventricosus TaxID=182803 RepID=A0A4Y2E260_ARAVE|nr:Aminomethyltransferase, mitochondrial [Araneus ventricosus]
MSLFSNLSINKTKGIVNINVVSWTKLLNKGGSWSSGDQLSSFWKGAEPQFRPIQFDRQQFLHRQQLTEDYEWDCETLDESIQKLPCHELHEENKAVFTQYSGFHVPICYENQELRNEVLDTRACGSIYDASYKRQFLLIGKDSSKFLDALVTSDIESLEEWQSVKTLMTNHNGGIIDELLVSKRTKEKLHIVANRPKVLTEVQNHLKSFEGDVSFQIAEEKCYLTFQGPECSTFLKTVFNNIENLRYMHNKEFDGAFITRCSTTGDDGYSISCKEGISLVNSLKKGYNKQEVNFISLKAKQCLTIEAGMCSSGVDFDENTTPVEADLTDLISKRKKKNGGFPGSEVILKQLRSKPSKIRKGFISEDAWLLKGGKVMSPKGEVVGEITSSTYSPCITTYIGMGYVSTSYCMESEELLFRNKKKGRLHKIPFVPNGILCNRMTNE